MSKRKKTEAAGDASRGNGAEPAGTAAPGAAGESPVDESQEAPPPEPAERIERLEAALNERHEAHLRAVAEAENIRRRAQREVSEAYTRGQRQIARELLAALDSLELGLGSSKSATAESLLEGQRATLRQLRKALKQFGVEAVEPEGQPFDPELHEAVALQPSDAVDRECVLSVMQKGYLMRGGLLRAAKVVVSSGPPEAEEDGDGGK